jgi:hypothetical protein
LKFLKSITRLLLLLPHTGTYLKLLQVSFANNVKKLLFITFLQILTIITANAQFADDNIDPDNFNYNLFCNTYVQSINNQRGSLNLEPLLRNEVLEKAALYQSEYMNKTKKTNLYGGKGRKTTGDRITYYGGTSIGQEIVQTTTIGRDAKTYFTYQQVVNDLFARLGRSKKYTDMLNSTKAFYIGIGATLDPSGKKIFVSIVVGGLESINEGKKLRKMLRLPYSKKNYGLEYGDLKTCRNCERFDDYAGIQAGMSIVQGKILFDYNNLRKLRKLITTSEDGLAIDIIQKEQYPCDTFNIYDSEKPNRGILLKPVMAKDLWKVNTEPERYNKYSGYLCKIPRKVLKKLGDQYEINVNVIQKGKVCKRITRTYNETNDRDKLNRLNLLPDTIRNCVFCNIIDDLSIDSTKNTLVFRVPFDKNKSSYRFGDLEPIIKALNEPKFSIDSINIVAFTSLEGDSVKNAILQIKRAKSIVQALHDINKQDFINTIETYDAWDMFKEQVKGTERYMFGLMTKQQLIDTLNRSKLLRKELEDILQEERVTLVHMKITYATEGENELPFLVYSIQKAIDKEQLSRAMRIQKYAVQQCMLGRFDAEKLLKINYPFKKEYIPFHLNNLFLESRFLRDDSVTFDIKKKLYKLGDLDPNNDLIKYNKMISFIKNATIKDLSQIKENQVRIDNLHKSKFKLLTKERIDLLDLEYQFKIIDQLDSLGVSSTNKDVLAAIEKVKALYAISTSGNKWENALKMADIFMRYNDNRAAIKFMAPFLKDENISEKFIYGYIACAAHYAENWYTPDFRVALSRAKELNPKRYCALFAEPFLSIQVLENPLIKREYCEACR